MPLTPRKHHNSPYYNARGTIPARQPDGTIANVRIERSTGSKSKRRATEICRDFERYYHDLAYKPQTTPGKPFAEAALVYIQTKGGVSDRFVTKLIKYFKLTPITEIDQAAVAKAAMEIYPGLAASSHIRGVYAPTTTILRLSGINPCYTRPKVERTPIVVPKEDWFDTVLPHCPPKLGALLITLTLRGRRVTELLRIRPEEIDFETGDAVIGRTKNGEPVLVNIPNAALELLKADRPKGWTGRNSKSAFGYVSRSNVYRALKKICAEIGADYYSTHPAGRHAFATRLLKADKSLKFVKEAGGWKSIKMPAMLYGHLEKSEVDDEVKRMGEEWGSARTSLKKNNKNQ